jgi:hypothetical protein
MTTHALHGRGCRRRCHLSGHIADLRTVRSIEAVSEPRLGGMRAVRLGHVFGVPVFLTPSWLIVALIVTVTFADIFVRAVPGTSTAAAHLLAFAFALLLAVSVLLHELDHVLTALSLRLKVNRVVIFLFGGASEIDRSRAAARRVLVSAAGPLVSAALAVLPGSPGLGRRPLCTGRRTGTARVEQHLGRRVHARGPPAGRREVLGPS